MESTEPIRLTLQGSYQRKPLPYCGIVNLPEPCSCSLAFSEVLARRRSADSFLQLSDSDLSNFFFDVASVQQTNLSDVNRQKRYVASMGALHPSHLLIYQPERGWFVYLPERHSLGVLAVDDAHAWEIRRIASEHHPSATATILCLLSDLDLVANYYDDFLGLLLKDAGVVLGHASLVAAAHNLNFRILGRSAIYAFQGLICNMPFRSLSCGLALLGRAGT